MGIFTSLITLPLAPARGAAWVAQQVADEVDRELYDESRIRRELLQLELDHDDGLIEDEQRATEEDALLERLALANRRTREERILTVAESEHPAMTEEKTTDG